MFLKELLAGRRERGLEVIQLMFDLNAQAGTTLVMVTHDEQLAQRCGRIVRLAGGKVVR